VKADTPIDVLGGLFVALLAETTLRSCVESFMTARAVGFDIRVLLNHWARHDQLLEVDRRGWQSSRQCREDTEGDEFKMSTSSSRPFHHLPHWSHRELHRLASDVLSSQLTAGCTPTGRLDPLVAS
jgi:hypothetical protein